MTFMSSWIISVVVFVVLLLLMGVVFWKKDILFDKLNHYADQHKATGRAPFKVREANGFLLTIVYYVARIYLLLCGVRVNVLDKVGRVEKPSIVLCNHGSYIDFIYVMALLRKYKPNMIAARLYFYNTFLRKLLHVLGAFPKSMFALDLESTKNCLAVLKNNGCLAMMPEARLSTVGKFEDIQANTYSFIKSAGVNVYTVKISGDYFADPKWSKGFRRGAVVEAELELLYTAEEIKKRSTAELRDGVERRLYYDEFLWLSQRPTIRYYASRMAEGLENILMLCPVCCKRHTIVAKKNHIYCEHCGYLTSLNHRYLFSEGFTFENFAEWYEWQFTLLKKEIIENPEYKLSSRVELRLPGVGSGLTRRGGTGVCTLCREGLSYSGIMDDTSVELHFPLRRIYRLLFGAGENFEIYDGANILYFVPEERRSAVDWYMASMILYDESCGVDA